MSAWREQAGRSLVAAASVVVAAAVVGPTLVPGSTLGRALRLGFRTLCHQEAARSFFFLGHPLSVCHRCTGIYAAFLVGTLLALAGLRVPATSKVGWGLAILPMLAHVAVQNLVPVLDQVALRVLTGSLFGLWGALALMSVLTPSSEPQVIASKKGIIA